ncbi:multidrug effflux MFS transporter [Deinococcus yavapaiensis]|uniref:DHA1 family bicyclomycin/chloramphenicol resistance-like MFS transporter n=1 Tax=Deinococcus yavapaiensis KR-236 TaxID=694435 RepID=A0A318SCC8_9DEIO|nr:multidrug effflux MFS transporter [Deinococcus yavapaiensis]PYE48986.1 DHA1 family bicyclomycin/chloramphenicol resistance-like MFS transporter [Deinococcus yavapaiensis KR-236]
MSTESNPRRSALLTVILGGLQAFGPLSIDMYLPGLPAIARDLGASEGTAQFTLSAFLIGMAIGQAVYGPITDKYGRKSPLRFGVVLYVIASVLCTLAPSVGVLILGRFLQALGASAGAVITTAVVRDVWSGKAAADRFSLLMLVMGVAPILAPLLGSIVLAHFDWHAVFWILAVFGALCLAAISALPETAPRTPGKSSRLRDGLRTYALLTRDTGFVTYALAGSFASSTMFAYITASSFVFVDLFGVAPGTYGLLFGLNALGLIVASQVNRALLRRLPIEVIASFATLALALFASLLLLVTLLGQANAVVFAALLFGLLTSLGFTFPNTTALALESIRTNMGSASAFRGTVQFALSGLAGSLVGVLANGTALPMASVIFVCAILATVFLSVARRVRPSV